MTALAALLMIAATDPYGSYSLVNPRAIELFERDPQLHSWAVARFDSNGDGHLSIFEADPAAKEFKSIADGDTDGQVTPSEYRSARDFIAARWAIRR